jgi:hypothetical protein
LPEVLVEQTTVKAPQVLGAIGESEATEDMGYSTAAAVEVAATSVAVAVGQMKILAAPMLAVAAVALHTLTQG